MTSLNTAASPSIRRPLWFLFLLSQVLAFPTCSDGAKEWPAPSPSTGNCTGWVGSVDVTGALGADGVFWADDTTGDIVLSLSCADGLASVTANIDYAYLQSGYPLPHIPGGGGVEVTVLGPPHNPVVAADFIAYHYDKVLDRMTGQVKLMYQDSGTKTLTVAFSLQHDPQQDVVRQKQSGGCGGGGGDGDWDLD